MASHELTAQNIPYGLLAFDGGLLSPSSIAYNKKERPLNPLWFRTYLIPRTPDARKNLTQVLREYIAERGIFFIKPFDDEKLLNTDWQERFLGGDEHEDAVLFRNMYGGAESAHKDSIQIAMLENVLVELEKGNPLDFLSTSPNLDDFSFQISYPYSVVNYLKDYDAMNRGQRHNDLVNALRAHLVRRLEWPVFIQSARAGRETAIERFKKRAEATSRIVEI
ncbi:MAG: hypothetical protein V4495_25610 [Pseudomonadota bacterium]